MSVLDRQVREELRATIDQARRVRIETQERRDSELREMEESRTARNRAERERRRAEVKAKADAELLAAEAKTKADTEAAALIEAIVLGPCHPDLRATRLATWEDVGKFPEDLRCPRCRMILDGPA